MSESANQSVDLLVFDDDFARWRGRIEDRNSVLRNQSERALPGREGYRDHHLRRCRSGPVRRLREGCFGQEERLVGLLLPLMLDLTREAV